MDTNLTKSEASFCENAGLAGVLLSLTCLLQQFVFMLPHWISFVIAAVYISSAIGFLLLAKKSAYAFWIILVNTILLFLVESYVMLSMVFLLVLVLLFLYSLVLVVWMQITETNKSLIVHQRMIKDDREQWDGVL
ncbi:MAG: hypothetical protein JWQ27_1423 [Ferruginibacter sp.]|nr:hypothetical protein [Ferruginibacter sp.]